ACSIFDPERTCSAIESDAEHIFFYSSRRRHTRFTRDWSSDMCSSDLPGAPGDERLQHAPQGRVVKALVTGGAGFAGGTCRSGCSPPATRKIHHRRLGKIGFRPAAHATTQDPDNLPDSYRQVLRWHLGFWQTLRRHGLWRSGFCAALVLFVAEML